MRKDDHMKKAIYAAIAAALALSAFAERMASQTYVDRTVEAAKDEVFEAVGTNLTQRLDEMAQSVRYIEELFNDAVPALTNAWEYESLSGTNSAWYVYQYDADTNKVGKFLAYSGTSGGTDEYRNESINWTLYIHGGWEDVTSKTSNYEYASYTYENYVITNDVFVYQLQTNYMPFYIPVYNPGYWTTKWYTNWVNGVAYVSKQDYYVEPELDHYAVSNGVINVVDTSYTNTTYTYVLNVTTNSVDDMAVSWFTNTYDKSWIDAGGVTYPQQNVYSNMKYLDEHDNIIRVMKYPCSDKVRNEALGVTE